MVKWNLFADGSLYGKKGHENEIVVPGGWACILQRAEVRKEEEIVCFGSEMTIPNIWRMEMRAIVRGLQLAGEGDHVRIFSDSVTALGSILGSIESHQMGSFLQSIEPAEKRQHYQRQLNHLFGAQRGHTLGTMVAGARQDEDILRELRALLLKRDVAFTKVSDMKIAKGQQLFETHARCDFLAREVRRSLMRSIGLLPDGEQVNMHWPYVAGPSSK